VDVTSIKASGPWTVGDRVKHLTVPDWNVGEVVDVSDSKQPVVEFVGWGRRNVAAEKLGRLTEDELDALLPKGRAKKGPSRPAQSLSDYRTVFLTLFPKGFKDQNYLAQERSYKVNASERLHEILDERALKRLVRSGNFDEVATRAKHLISRTNLVFRNEQMDLTDGLRHGGAQEAFALALQSLLYGSAGVQSRMEDFMDALSVVSAPKWTIATYFLFLADPKQHMFIKPTPTKRIAAACGVELNYRPELNWLTYACALKVASVLDEQLSDLKPRDMIDLQSFIWVTARD